MRIEGRKVVGRRIEENGYYLLCLKVFKIKGEWKKISIFIVCNFVNMIMVNLVIHLVKHFYALLFFQISSIWGN